MKDLKEPCKSMLASGKCFGCSQLELDNFQVDPNCIYIPTANESIKKIKEILGVQMKI
jgi:hypothetical protein